MEMLTAGTMSDTGHLLTLLGIAIALSAYLSAIRLIAIQKIGDLHVRESDVEQKARSVLRVVIYQKGKNYQERLTLQIYQAIENLEVRHADQILSEVRQCLETSDLCSKQKTKLLISDNEGKNELADRIQKSVIAVMERRLSESKAYVIAYEIAKNREKARVDSQKKDLRQNLSHLMVADLPLILSATLLGFYVILSDLELWNFADHLQKLLDQGQSPVHQEGHQFSFVWYLLAGLSLFWGLSLFLIAGTVMFGLHLHASRKTWTELNDELKLPYKVLFWVGGALFSGIVIGTVLMFVL
ncbi:hypothetical protein [Gimesia chilikensis]|uniref:hypothetical protein n=1 Tax=Gimesia chilikensis TaxID=2605989 RepID=UPI00118B0BA2|nr:hypothetical protein [Gimesia chilikensis]QDT85116.1 hypothetical protein MalM14_27830 [Gimesia chilikensis]